MNGAVAGIAYLILIPMVVWGLSTFWPITMNADLTRFRGKYYRWRIEHNTGTVLDSDTTTHTTTTTTYTDTGPRRSVATSVHGRIRLLLEGGRQTDVHLENYGSICSPGDVISVWLARKGHKKVPFVVLNLTTEQEYSAPRASGIGAIIITHTLLFGLLLAPAFLAAFFAGGGGILLGLLLLFGTAAGWNLTRRRFVKRGTRRLWERSRQEAQALATATG